MVSLRDLPSASTIYTAYASLSASTMLLRTTFNQVIPLQLQNLILSTIRHFILKPKNTSTFTLIIDQNNGMAQNEIFNASEIYTSTKINPQTDRLKISKGSQDNHLTLKLADSQTTLVDSFQGVEITWRFICQELKDTSNNDHHHDTYDDFDNFLVKEKRSFELSFDKKHKDLVLNRYVPFVLERAKAIRDEKKVVKLHTLTNPCSARVVWDSVKLEHPSTFDKLAMEPSLKKTLVDDLDRFLDRKEYYKKVGRAWKRGYLLYGPPGTGKANLIAGMANYLKFDIYDLQLMNVINDSSLRKLLLSTTNKSILVIEDIITSIDCSVESPDRSYNTDQRPKTLQFTLAGLLNFIDGLWSSCGDASIIIFTANNKDRLDPALLRPGRMDMHIHVLSYDSGI